MVWRLPGDKPLSEPMINSLTYICVTDADSIRAADILALCIVMSSAAMTLVMYERQNSVSLVGLLDKIRHINVTK